MILEINFFIERVLVPDRLAIFLDDVLFGCCDRAQPAEKPQK